MTKHKFYCKHCEYEKYTIIDVSYKLSEVECQRCNLRQFVLSN